jgi:hypothetical protein
MDRTLKIVNKLLNKFILPKYEDIMEYSTSSYNEFKEIEITFWMDGTDQEMEEEIVSECDSVLSIVGPTDYRFIYKFTTNGINFYTYS